MLKKMGNMQEKSAEHYRKVLNQRKEKKLKKKGGEWWDERNTG